VSTTKAIRREMRRRAAIEPVIGHLKEDHRMGRKPTSPAGHSALRERAAIAVPRVVS
jgi:hypothetical protein